MKPFLWNCLRNSDKNIIHCAGYVNMYKNTCLFDERFKSEFLKIPSEDAKYGGRERKTRWNLLEKESVSVILQIKRQSFVLFGILYFRGIMKLRFYRDNNCHSKVQTSAIRRMIRNWKVLFLVDQQRDNCGPDKLLNG